jgi:hypothetical protein
MIKEAEDIIDSLDVDDDTKERLKMEINIMILAENPNIENLRREMLGFVPKIHCQQCCKEIPYDEKYIKNNLLYVTSNWHKCLCFDCTNEWRKNNARYL